MGTFKITSSTLNSQYEYKNESVIANGFFVKDAPSNEVQSANGSFYRINSQGDRGDYIGNYNGYMRDGEMKYSLSEMSRKDSNLVWDAIDEIEQFIMGENE